MLKLLVFFILITMPLSAFAGDSARKNLKKAAKVAPDAETDVNNHREKRGTAKLANIFDGADESNNQTSRKPGKGKRGATNRKSVAGKAARPNIGEGKSAPGSMRGTPAYSLGGDGVVPEPSSERSTQSKTSTRGAAKKASSNKPVEEPAIKGDSGNDQAKTTGHSSKDLFTKRTKENQGIVCDAGLGDYDGTRYAEAKFTKAAPEADLVSRIDQCWNNPAYHSAYDKGERRYLVKMGCTYSAGAAQARQQQEKGGAIPPHAKWCHSITRRMSDMYAAGWTDVNNKAKGIEAKAAGIEQEEAEEWRAANERAEYAAAHPSEKIDWGAIGAAAIGIISDTGAALQAQADKEAKEAARNQRIRDEVANQNAQIAADNANASRNSTYTNHIGGGSSSGSSGGGGSSGSTGSGYIGCTKGSFVDSNGNACP